MSLTLWLIRHGQTTINAGSWSCKPEDTRLTTLGEQQAMQAAAQVDRQPDLIIVSPLIRARDSARYLLQRWPESPQAIWPIQEFIYLSPMELQRLEKEQRQQLIAAYWQKNDPCYCHADDTESFSAFLQRIESFHQQISTLTGFVLVFGHGQFFKAYQLGLNYGFAPSATWMKMYRQEEINNPLKNGEIVKILFA